MKAILEFDLENEDDKMSHLRCIKSLDMSIILFEIIHNLKKKCTNTCDEGGDMYDGVDLVFEQINILLEENGININDLIK